MKATLFRLFKAVPERYIGGDNLHDNMVILHWMQENARFTALCTTLLLITGIILAVMILRRQRKLNRKLDELALLLKEKEKEENPEN